MPDECNGRKLRVAYLGRTDFAFSLIYYDLPIEGYYYIENFVIGRLYTDYSNKNIPIPSWNEYKIQLISKVKNVLKRIRWKAFQFLGNLKKTTRKHTDLNLKYALKALMC